MNSKVIFADGVAFDTIAAYSRIDRISSVSDVIVGSDREVLELHFDSAKVSTDELMPYYTEADKTAVLRLVDEDGQEFVHSDYVIPAKLGKEYVGEDANPHIIMTLAQLSPTDKLLRDIAGKRKVYAGTELEVARERKIDELSAACKAAISAGVTADGRHYSMTTEDQINLESLKTAIMGGAEAVPYHADGCACEIYPAADFLAVYSACAAHKIGQTTYFNQLRQYVLSLESVEEIEAVVYGQELTGAYLDAYSAIIGAIG